MRLNFIFLFLILPVSLFGQKIGIIGAMPEEIRILTENLEEKAELERLLKVYEQLIEE
jgi:nucleoside phosphorylase